MVLATSLHFYRGTQTSLNVFHRLKPQNRNSKTPKSRRTKRIKFWQENANRMLILKPQNRTKNTYSITLGNIKIMSFIQPWWWERDRDNIKHRWKLQNRTPLISPTPENFTLKSQDEAVRARDINVQWASYTQISLTGRGRKAGWLQISCRFEFSRRDAIRYPPPPPNEQT